MVAESTGIFVRITCNSNAKPLATSVSVELGSSKPRYQANTGAGAPVALHCRVVDWPTAREISRYGPDVIEGSSAAHSTYTCYIYTCYSESEKSVIS